MPCSLPLLRNIIPSIAACHRSTQAVDDLHPSACDTVADMAWFDFSIVDTPPEIPISEYVLAINNFFKIFKVDMSRKIIVIMNPSFYNRNVGLNRN